MASVSSCFHNEVERRKQVMEEDQGKLYRVCPKCQKIYRKEEGYAGLCLDCFRKVCISSAVLGCFILVKKKQY